MSFLAPAGGSADVRPRRCFAQALAKDPVQWFASTGEFASALRDAVTADRPRHEATRPGGGASDGAVATRLVDALLARDRGGSFAPSLFADTGPFALLGRGAIAHGAVDHAEGLRLDAAARAQVVDDPCWATWAAHGLGLVALGRRRPRPRRHSSQPRDLGKAAPSAAATDGDRSGHSPAQHTSPTNEPQPGADLARRTAETTGTKDLLAWLAWQGARPPTAIGHR
jgi:hypothetical protein